MRIAILTQPLRTNYGGVLQNYALQQVLIKLGHKPITLEKHYLQKISIFRLIIELPKRLYTKYILKRRKYILNERHHDYFDELRKTLKPFVDTQINHSYFYDYNEIKLSEYSAFIVGSDQVWRPKYNGDCLEEMFLSFTFKSEKIKRVAYAASFGVKEWEYDEEQTKRCSELINRFNAVSTREIDGVEMCSKYLGYKNAVSVLDPTLLLDKPHYLELCKNIKHKDEEILFAYILDKDETTIAKLKDIATQNNLKLKLTSAADECCKLSMEEWLAMFRDAKMVITDSFHGSVFSIIFNKEFYTIINQSRGVCRITSLLSQLSLTDRMLDIDSEITINKIINWSNVNDKLSCLKDQSYNFLRTNLF